MSWTRQNYENEYYIKTNFTSGYWGNDASVDSYGPFEYEMITERDQNPENGYLVPRLKYFADYTVEADSGVPFIENIMSNRYYIHQTRFVIVGYPDVNTHGYFYATTTDYPYKAKWKVGFQSRINIYNKSDDSWKAAKYFPAAENNGQLDPPHAIYAGGMVSEMEEFIDFYKTSYASAPFIVLSMYHSDVASVNNDGDDDSFLQVPYNSYHTTLSIKNEPSAIRDTDGYVIPLDEVTGGDNNDSQHWLPFYELKDNTATTDTVPSRFNITFYNHPTSYNDYIKFLKNRFKYQDLIDEQNAAYVANKVSILADMLDTVLSMPKEFRVRMQPSSPYDLSKISSISGMEETTTTDTETASAGTLGTMPGSTSGGSTGGGSMGGSY